MIVDWSTYGYISTQFTVHTKDENKHRKRTRAKSNKRRKLFPSWLTILRIHFRYTAILAVMQEVAHFFRTEPRVSGIMFSLNEI